MDDEQQGNSDVVKLSEVCTTQVCWPNDHRPSPSTQSVNCDTPAQVDNTIDTIQRSTVMSDNEICGYQKADGQPFGSLFTLEHFVNVHSHACIGDEPSVAGSCNTWMPDSHPS